MTDQDEVTAPSARQLAVKYGTKVFENPPSITRSRWERMLRQRDAIDQHFASTSMTFASGILKRRALDERTRLLVLLGQFAVTKSHGHLEDTLRAAIAADVPVRDCLEAILMCLVYAGDTALQPALEIFVRVAKELGVLEGLRGDQLPVDGRDRERSLEAERKTWSPEVEHHPLREQLMRKHGWLGISTGLKYRGPRHLEIMHELDGIDEEFSDLLEHFAYQGMYSRRILDDKTRVLCTVGDCVALGEMGQAREHMRSALAVGATPREVMEITVMSGPYFGMPGAVTALHAFVAVLSEEGRLAEIGK